MKTLLSPDLDAQPLLLVDCEARVAKRWKT